MRSDNAKPIQSVLLLVTLLLAACDSGDKTSCAPAPVSAPVPISAPVVTSMGTDFYLTLPDNNLNVSFTNKLIVAAAAATSGEVTFNGVVTPFSVTPSSAATGGEVVITLDPAVVLKTNEVIEAKGIHVTSLSPVSVHVVSESTYSADGYLALPTAGLGTSYYVMSYANTVQPGTTRPKGSEFAVVATQNSTSVTITPKADGLTKLANIAFTIVLNSGETYQFANTADADLTGTLVTADKPIAVFSGHGFANVPSGTGWGDYMVEQLPDVSVWGKTHHTSPFSGRTNYTVRVMSSQNGTTFNVSPSGLAGTLNAGQYADVDLSGVGEFISNNPVLVAQFMRGYEDEIAFTKKGDPSMVIVTPVEQAMTDSTFGVHGLAGTTWAYMNIVTETAALANLMLDNVAVNTTLFTPVGGTSIYSVGTIPVTPGAHTLQGSVPYSALVYDYGIAVNAVSYIYPVAAKLSAPVTLTSAPASPSPAVCVNNQVTGNDQSIATSELEEHEDHPSNDRHGHHLDDHGHDLDA